MLKKIGSLACLTLALTLPLSGCYLASNGLDYSNQKVITNTPPPAAMPAGS